MRISLDAVGITKPEHSNVELQQIVLSPSSLRHHLLKQANPFTLDDPVLEQTETLVQAEKSTGAKNLKEFFNKMHQEMKEILTSQHEDRKRIRNEKLQFSKARLQKRKGFFYYLSVSHPVTILFCRLYFGKAEIWFQETYTGLR